MSEWRPIDSAPKDGRRILTYTPAGHYQGVDVNYWVDKHEHPWGDKWWRSSTLTPPTHWRELPDRPE
jgi:hypothetical protein